MLVKEIKMVRMTTDDGVKLNYRLDDFAPPWVDDKNNRDGLSGENSYDFEVFLLRRRLSQL